MSTYGVGIIGAGWVAGEYVKVFRDDPRTQLRRDLQRGRPGKAAALLRTHGVEAKEYGSVDELFDDERRRHRRLLHAPGRPSRALRASGRDGAAHRDREADRPERRGHPRHPRRGGEGRRQDGDERRPALESPVSDRAPADRGRRARRPRLRRGRLLAPAEGGVPGLPRVRVEVAGRQRVRLRRLPRGRHPPLPGRRDRRGGCVLGAEANQHGLRVRPERRRLAALRERRGRQARDDLRRRHRRTSSTASSSGPRGRS